MLAPLRGTNQYWFRVKGEVKAMIAEYGSPTLFLTLSCAEYDSADIAQYLRKVNNAPQSYSIARLCTHVQKLPLASRSSANNYIHTFQ